MNFKLLINTTACLLLLNTGSAVAEIDQMNTSINGLAGTAIARTESLAQVVTAGKSGVLTSVDFSIRKFEDSSFGDVIVEIREATSGEPEPAILGAKTFPNS